MVLIGFFHFLLVSLDFLFSRILLSRFIQSHICFILPKVSCPCAVFLGDVRLSFSAVKPLGMQNSVFLCRKPFVQIDGVPVPVGGSWSSLKRLLIFLHRNGVIERIVSHFQIMCHFEKIQLT